MASRPRSVWAPVALGAFVGVLVLVLDLLGALAPFENAVWDLRVQTLAAPSPATPTIDVVLLDQASLDWALDYQGMGWPWDRRMYGLVADFLARGGARATVFDVLFDQASGDAGADSEFAEALRANGRVILAQAVESRPQGLVALSPIPELAGAAAGLGHVLSSSDSDGVNRRIAPVVRLANGQELRTLALATLALATPTVAGSAPLGSEALLRYRGGPTAHRVVPARQILNAELQIRQGLAPELDPQEFRDHYVFFGFSAPGLLDLRPSPVDKAYPGVLVHATYLDNLLAGDGLRPAPGWAPLAVFVWAWGATLAVSRIRRVVPTALLFLLGLGLPVALGWAAYLGGWSWPVVPGVLGALGGGLAMVLFNYAWEGRQRRFIQGAFGQYLSPEVISRLVENPDLLQLGGEKRCLSIFFSDVAGFTSISERLKDDPVALTGLLNDYLSEMTAIIYRHGGTIDKYEGDAIIAFWNAPLDLPNHAEQAVRASLACQARLEEIQPRLSLAAGRPFYARIGLNTGAVVIGNMGSAQRFNYTFLGDAGNLASRLEGINKLFGTRLLVSEFTKDAVGAIDDLVWREIGRVRVVGKDLPVTVYEPLLSTHAPSAQMLGAFDKGLRSWYGGDFPTALGIFDSLAEVDPPARQYAAKTRELLASPPPHWDGVWEAKEK